jgi:cytochrome c
MKKIVIALLGLSLLAAKCSDSKPDSNKPSDKGTIAANDAKPADDALKNNPVYKKGLELYAVNDCNACHALNDRIKGPSYAEIAAKYKGDEKMVPELAKRIIKGGKGVWGDEAMTAHPALSQEDAEALVRYVYLIK